MSDETPEQRGTRLGNQGQQLDRPPGTSSDQAKREQIAYEREKQRLDDERKRNGG